MTSNRRALLVTAYVVGTVILDRVTKVIAVRTLEGEPVRSYLFDTFRLGYAENPGAFLSLGASLSAPARFWTFVVLVGAGLAAMLAWALRGKSLSAMETVALALVAGGGLSNLWDRIVNPEHVVIDFMNLGVGWLRTGIFNVADVAIMAGAGLLVIALWRAKATARPAGEGSQQD